MAWTLQPWHGKSLVEGAATLAFQKCLKSKQQSAHWNKLRTSMTYVANISLDENFKKYFTKSSNIPKSNWLWNKSWGRLKFVAQDDRMWHSSRAKRRIRILRPASQSSLAKWTPRNPMAFTRLTQQIQLQWFKVMHWRQESSSTKTSWIYETAGSTARCACFQGKFHASTFVAQPCHGVTQPSPCTSVDRYGPTGSVERSQLE